MKSRLLVWLGMLACVLVPMAHAVDGHCHGGPWFLKSAPVVRTASDRVGDGGHTKPA